MKVGDLVKKETSTSPTPTILLGIVVEMEKDVVNTTHAKVCWGEYGTFWQNGDSLEVLNASR